jgi:membrane protease YdiL (CAAX protease family)
MESESSLPSTTSGNAEDPAPPPPPRIRRIPYWHTVVLVAVILLLSLGNAQAQNLHEGISHLRLYIGTMVYEWLLTLYVWWGLRRAGMSLRELVGGRWHSLGDCVLDGLIAAGTWMGALMILALAAWMMGLQHTNLEEAQKQLSGLAPQNTLEIVLWICLSSTAGICEEILFRGYLQMQFTRLLRSPWTALLVASALFGLSHGYEGPQRMVLIALLGFIFGLVSMARKSLRPAMMAHTLHDTISGLMLRALS